MTLHPDVFPFREDSQLSDKRTDAAARVLAGFSVQAVPALLNDQSRLANDDNSQPPTADYTLTFNPCASATDVLLVWGPQPFNGAMALRNGWEFRVVQTCSNVMLGFQS